MLSRLRDSIDSGRGALSRHLVTAEDRVLDTLRDAGTEALRRRDAGLELARALSDSVATSSRNAGRSLAQVVRQRPAETVLLVAAIAFATGWLVQRLRRGAAQEDDEVPVAAPKRARRRTG